MEMFGYNKRSTIVTSWRLKCWEGAAISITNGCVYRWNGDEDDDVTERESLPDKSKPLVIIGLLNSLFNP